MTRRPLPDEESSQGELFPGAAEDGPRPQVKLERYAFGLDQFLPDDLIASLPLEERTASMYGRLVQVPRLECWYGTKPYAFGGKVMNPMLWWDRPATIVELQKLAEGVAGVKFNSCFVNLYRDGQDCLAWHADDESWMGPVIASVSIGASRKFVLRHNTTGAKWYFQLGHGDVLVMLDGVQRDWQHSVPRTKRKVGLRLNLTFRSTLS